MVVPTGVGASIGGFAGDASRAAQKIAEKIPLIVNPNVVNAAVFSGITENMLYVEGWSLTNFVKGTLGLKPSYKNKIGVVFDSGISQRVLNIHINTINALKTVYDFDVAGYEITDESAGVEFFCSGSNVSTGTLKCPAALLRAGEKLIDKGAQAIAAVCAFDEPPEDDYENGEGVDIVGGVEAVISHYMTSNLMCQCVHAPAFEHTDIEGHVVDPKCAAEYITPTFLPCLFFGLNNAPLITTDLSESCLTSQNIHSLVMPYNALGSSIVFDAIEQGIPVYAVRENSAVLDVDAAALGLASKIRVIDSYEDYIKEL